MEGILFASPRFRPELFNSYPSLWYLLRTLRSGVGARKRLSPILKGSENSALQRTSYSNNTPFGKDWRLDHRTAMSDLAATYT